MLTFFILLQFILLLFMLLHDWIAVPPFNDIDTLKIIDGRSRRILGTLLNGLTVLIPLLITIKYYSATIFPHSAAKMILIFYACLTAGTILSWWVPYFFG